MPRMTGFDANFVTRFTVFVAPTTNQKRPVKSPAPQIMPALTAPPEAIAAPPMAFIGCTRIGV